MTATTKKPARTAAKKSPAKPAIGSGSPKLDRTLDRAAGKVVNKPATPTPPAPVKPSKPTPKVAWKPVPAKDYSAKVAGKRVHLLTAGVNPKHGKSAKRFDLYKEGMTVEAALSAGVLLLDLQWDASPHHAWRNQAGEVVRGAFIELK